MFRENITRLETFGNDWPKKMCEMRFFSNNGMLEEGCEAARNIRAARIIRYGSKGA
jgi:hypothetical protein